MKTHLPVCLLPHPDQGVVLVLSVCLQPSVHVSGDVAHGLLPLGGVTYLRALRHGADLVDVDAGAAVEHPPDESRTLEEEGHEEEDDGHPLVIGELLALTVLPVHGDLVVQGDVEGVLHPAVGPRVGREGVCEVGGTPALDGTSHVLTAGDEHREQGQQHLEEGKVREGGGQRARLSLEGS